MPDEIIPDEIVIKTGKVKKYAPYVAVGAFAVGIVVVLVAHNVKLESLSKSISSAHRAIDDMLDTEDLIASGSLMSKIQKNNEALETLLDK